MVFLAVYQVIGEPIHFGETTGAPLRRQSYVRKMSGKTDILAKYIMLLSYILMHFKHDLYTYTFFTAQILMIYIMEKIRDANYFLLTDTPTAFCRLI